MDKITFTGSEIQRRYVSDHIQCDLDVASTCILVVSDKYEALEGGIDGYQVISAAKAAQLIADFSSWFSESITWATGDESAKKKPHPYTDYVQPATVQTTDATQTTIDSVTITEDETVGLEVKVTGIKSDGTDSLHLVRHATYQNDGGTVTVPGSGYATNAHYERDNTNWDVELAINGTAVDIKVTGVAATTINWSSRIEVML